MAEFEERSRKASKVSLDMLFKPIEQVVADNRTWTFSSVNELLRMLFDPMLSKKTSQISKIESPLCDLKNRLDDQLCFNKILIERHGENAGLDKTEVEAIGLLSKTIEALLTKDGSICVDYSKWQQALIVAATGYHDFFSVDRGADSEH